MAKKENIVFFPTLDSFDNSDWKVTCGTPKFTYKNEAEEEKQLEAKGDSKNNHGEFTVSDGVFDPAVHNLALDGEIILVNADVFYGAEGIVPESAELGIAVIWSAAGNRIRGTVDCGCIDRGNGLLQFSCRKHDFEKGMLAVALELQYVLYLKSCGEVKEDEKHLAQIPGTLLGELGKYTYYFKGNSSLFPVVNCDFKAEDFLKDCKNALWMLDFSSSDPCADLFDKNNVCLYLNEGHRDFKRLDDAEQEESAGRLDNPLLREILSSASAVIIQKTVEKLGIEEWGKLQYDDTEPGSVAQAVLRMADKCGLDKNQCSDISYLTAKLGSAFFGFCSEGASK